MSQLVLPFCLSHAIFQLSQWHLSSCTWKGKVVLELTVWLALCKSPRLRPTRIDDRVSKLIQLRGWKTPRGVKSLAFFSHFGFPFLLSFLFLSHTLTFLFQDIVGFLSNYGACFCESAADIFLFNKEKNLKGGPYSSRTPMGIMKSSARPLE